MWVNNAWNQIYEIKDLLMALKSLHAKALTSPNVHVPLKSASHVHLPGRTCQFWLLMNQDKLARLVNQTLLQIAQIFYSRMFRMKSLYLFGTVQKVCLALMGGSINPISGSKTILLFGSRLLHQWMVCVFSDHHSWCFSLCRCPEPKSKSMKYEFIYRQFPENFGGDCSLSKLERVPDILWKSM